MVSRTAIALAIAVTAGLVAHTGAQEADAERPRALPNLRQRLEQFRNDIIGEAPPERPQGQPRQQQMQQQQQRMQPGQRPTNMPRNGAQPRSIMTQPGTMKQAARATGPSDATTTPRTTPGDVNSAVSTPSRLEVQSARRALPSLEGGVQPPVATVKPPKRVEKKTAQAIRPSKKPSAKPVAPPRAAPGLDDPLDESVAAGDDATPEADDEPQVVQSEPVDEPKALVEKDDQPEAVDAAESDDDTKVADDSSDDKKEAKSLDEPEAPSQPAGAGVLFTSQSPALNIEVAGPQQVMIGKEADFEVKVVNSGAGANDVVIAIEIPQDVEVLSAQASAGTARAAMLGDRYEPLQWKVSRLEARSTETLHVKLVPRKNTPLDLSVNWTFTPEASQALVEVLEPKLVMNISGPAEVLYGQSKIYKLIVSNPGNGDTHNVVVGLLPIGGGGETQASHRLGTLKAGESKTIDVELTARQAGAITIKAQAFADNGIRSEAAEQVLVRRADLLVEVEAPKVKYAGTVGTYHLKVVNAGNATAENVQLAAMLPPEAKYVASSAGGRFEAQQGKITWTIGTLQPGSERTFEMQCSLTAPGDNRMQFVATSDADLNAMAMASTHVEAIADLKLEVRDPQGPIAVGDDTVYEVSIRNRGTKAAEGVDLVVFFSEGLEATTVEGGPHEIGPGQVGFKSIAALPAGEVAVFRVHARADRDGNHVFRAEVACPSLKTKLAAEETTHFYGDDRVVAETATAEPTEATPLDALDAETSDPAPQPQAEAVQETEPAPEAQPQ